MKKKTLASMGFLKAVISGFSKFNDFSGRSSRSEFWYFFLFIFIFNLLVSALDDINFFLSILVNLIILFLFLPYLAVSNRRLHDSGLNGWWNLIQILPWIPVLIFINLNQGWLALIFIFLWFVATAVIWSRKGDEKENKYGKVLIKEE